MDLSQLPRGPTCVAEPTPQQQTAGQSSGDAAPPTTTAAARAEHLLPPKPPLGAIFESSNRHHRHSDENWIWSLAPCCPWNVHLPGGASLDETAEDAIQKMRNAQCAKEVRRLAQ